MDRKRGVEVEEGLDAAAEESYWQNAYQSRPYVEPGSTYDDYGPAYRYGWESRARYGDRDWDDIEESLERDWDDRRGNSSLAWERAKEAVRDAWDRIERALPGDADRDGR